MPEALTLPDNSVDLPPKEEIGHNSSKLWCASLSHHNFLTAANLGWGADTGAVVHLSPLLKG